MSLITKSQYASSLIIGSFFSTIGNSAKTATTPTSVRQIEIAPRQASQDIDDFLAEICAEDPRLEATISEGTKWVAESFYQGQPASFKKMRMTAGFTQAQLASSIGTSQPYIAKLERGEVSAGMDVIGRVAKALAMEPKEVFAMLYAEYEKKNG